MSCWRSSMLCCVCNSSKFPSASASPTTRSKRASSSLTLVGTPLSLNLLFFVFGTKGTSSICSSALHDDKNSIYASTRSSRVRSGVDSTCTSAPMALKSSVCVRASAMSMVCVAYFVSGRVKEDVDCAWGGRSAWNEGSLSASDIFITKGTCRRTERRRHSGRRCAGPIARLGSSIQEIGQPLGSTHKCKH